MKYAFIMNSGTLNPESYSTLYEDRQNRYYFAAVHGMDMAVELAEKLAAEGYDFIDLCGDFDAEKTEKIQKAAGKKLQVNFAKYTEEGLAKFEALTENDRYGIIVLGFDQKEERVRLTIESDEYNSYIAIVDKEESAAAEAKKMVEEGIHFIELCGYFNAKKAAAVSEAINHRIPIGYCGE
jgi:dihydropteroate synthase